MMKNSLPINRLVIHNLKEFCQLITQKKTVNKYVIVLKCGMSLTTKLKSQGVFTLQSWPSFEN